MILISLNSLRRSKDILLKLKKYFRQDLNEESINSNCLLLNLLSRIMKTSEVVQRFIATDSIYGERVIHMLEFNHCLIRMWSKNNSREI